MKARVWRVACGVVAGLLCVWAVVLYFSRYEQTYEHDGVTVSCYSVAKVGVVGGGALDYETDSIISRGYTYSTVRGEAAIEKLESQAGSKGSEAHVEDRIEYSCDRVRTARVATMALLLAPSAALAAVTIRWPRRNGSSA